MKNKRSDGLAGRLVVALVMAVFLGYGVFLLSMDLLGTRTVATVKSFRLEGFERDETIRNQYTFVYDYEFTAAGKQFEGRSRVIKEPIFLKAKGGSIVVSYLPCCPALNAPVRDFAPAYKPLIYLAVGAVLLGLLRKMR